MNTKRYTNYLLRRIYKLCRDNPLPVTLQKHQWSGWTDWEQIVIDPRKKVLATFIHECLHVLYPDWLEGKVYETEKLMLHNMSNTQFKNLAKILLTLL